MISLNWTLPVYFILSLGVCLSVAWLELSALRGRVSDYTANVSFFVLMTGWLLFYLFFYWDREIHPTVSSLSGVFVLSGLMKSVSYSQVSNQLRTWLRKESSNPTRNLKRGYSFISQELIRELRSGEVTPEELLGYGAMFRFVFYPTFCFQLKFQRTNRINWKKVVKNFSIMGVQMLIAMFVLMELLVPLIKRSYSIIAESKHPILDMSLIAIRVSVCGTIVHHVMFAGLLVGFTNGLAELTYFAHRDFFLDWWNMGSIDDFWRKWNRPVHQFLKRHIATPLLESVNSSENPSRSSFPDRLHRQRNSP